MLLATALTALLTAGSSLSGFHPDSRALPGSSVLRHLADGIESWALIAAVVGVVVGGVVWAFGHYSQNYQQAYNGRKGVLVSGLAALLVGAAPTIISFFVGQGQSVTK
jgi:MFS family permease